MPWDEDHPELDVPAHLGGGLGGPASPAAGSVISGLVVRLEILCCLTLRPGPGSLGPGSAGAIPT